MGWRAAAGLLAIGIAGCGVHLGYGDDEVVAQAGDPPKAPKDGTLDAQAPPVSPDGIVDGGGVVIIDDVDAASAPSPSPGPGPTPTTPTPASAAYRRVFVSSTPSSANLGGVTGADARCQDLANAANLGGSWRAWVSSSTSSPSVRFTKSSVPYRLLDETLVAVSWAELTGGSLRHAIDRDEKNVLTTGIEVWTATTSAGAYNGGGCNGFTSGANGAPTAAQGVTDQTDGDWTEVYVQFCDRTEPRIYCFEQ
jgi:hypothetical protein